jgi:sugar phosphate isomerase/epimerase
VTFPVLASTTSHKKEPLVPTLEVFARLGLRDLDLNLHHVLEEGVAVEDVADAVAAGGQRVWVASGGWCDFFHRPPRIEHTFDSVDRQVGIARRLGAGALRLFFGRLKRDDYTPADLDTIGENLSRLSDRHPELTFVFENHDGASLDPEVCRAVFERVNRMNIRMNFDPINFERAGVGALGALVTLRPFVAHVHLKGLDHGEFCEYGAGDVDLKPIVRSLLEESYDGRITVEYEGKSDGTLRLYQSVQRARADLATLNRRGSRPTDDDRYGSLKGQSD